MSCVFTRPTLPHGKLPTTDWDYDGVADYASWDNWATSDIVDADVIQRNWAILFSHVNGNLNGSDMDVDTASATSESSVLGAWSESTDWPIQNHRHSHDGVDSALLADDIITHSLLGTSAYCMLRSPSIVRNAVLIHGSADMESRKSRYTSSGIVEADVSFGYNYKEWTSGTSYIYREDATNGYCHVVVSCYVPNWASMSTAEKRALCVPYFSYTETSDKYDTVGVGVGRNELEGLSTETNIPSNIIFQWIGEYLV